MQRLKVRYRPEAIGDLDEIYRYIYRASLSPEIALGLLNRIRDRCRRIGDAPRGGRPREHLAPGLRTVPFGRTAVIAYRVDPDCVRIVNIFYGGRD